MSSSPGDAVVKPKPRVYRPKDNDFPYNDMGEDPVRMICPECSHCITTETSTLPNIPCILCFLLVCLLGVGCVSGQCCLTEHRCPNPECRVLIGENDCC